MTSLDGEKTWDQATKQFAVEEPLILLDAARQLLAPAGRPDVHATLAAIAAKRDETAATRSDVERTIEWCVGW